MGRKKPKIITDDVVREMIKLNLSDNEWAATNHKSVESIWSTLAYKLFGFSNDRDRLRLYSAIRSGDRKIWDAYKAAVSEIAHVQDRPLACSTPIRETDAIIAEEVSMASKGPCQFLIEEDTLNMTLAPEATFDAISNENEILSSTDSDCTNEYNPSPSTSVPSPSLDPRYGESYISSEGNLMDRTIESLHSSVGFDSSPPLDSRYEDSYNCTEKESVSEVDSSDQGHQVNHFSPDNAQEEEMKVRGFDKFEVVDNCSDVQPRSTRKTKAEKFPSRPKQIIVQGEKVPMDFDLKIPPTEWDKFVTWNPEKKKYGLKPGWTNLVRAHFTKTNPYCVLKFEDHKLNLEPTTKGHYFLANGRCKHNSENCFRFRFLIRAVPDQGNPIIIRVESDGDFHHRDGDVHSTKIQFDEREKLLKKSKHQKASAIATKIHAKANMGAVRLGNYSGIRSRQRLRQIRHERLAKHDLSKDPIVDLMKRIKKQRTKKRSKYIRQFSLKPFHVIYFSDRQVELMNKTKEMTGKLIGHLDSTGSLIKEISALGDKEMYVYSLAITNPLPKSPSLAVVEFISNNGSIKIIAGRLKYFSDKCRSILSIKGDEPLFTRLETDFSLAMIGACLESFQGVSTKLYLNRCWEIYFHNLDPFPTNFHVCRVHVSKALKDMLKKTFPKEGSGNQMSSQIQDTLYQCLQGYLRSTKFGSCVFRIKNIFTVCGQKFLSDSVRDAIESLNEIVPVSFHDDNLDQWKEFDVSPTTMRSINRGTAFGYYFHHLHSDTLESVNDIDLDLPPNPYYSPPFLKYLLRHILPYTPILTHLMFQITGDKREEDHQHAVESWNRTLKVDEQGQFGRQKIGRYIRSSQKMIKGRCNQFEADLNLFKNPPKTRRKRKSKKKPAVIDSFDSWDSISEEEKPFEVSRGRPLKRESGKKHKMPSRVSAKAKATLKRTPLESKDSTKLHEIFENEQEAYESTTLIHDEQKAAESSFEETPTSDLREVWRRRGSSVSSATDAVTIFREIPYICWGTSDKEPTHYKFINTCTIDNGLFTLTALLEWFPAINELFHAEAKSSAVAAGIVNAVGLIKVGNFNDAKAIWVKDVLGMDLVEASVGNNDLWGSEEEKLLQPMTKLFKKYLEVTRCEVHGILRQQMESLSMYSRSSVIQTVQEINGKAFSKNLLRCVHSDCTSKIQRTISIPKSGGLPLVVFNVSDHNVLDIPQQIELLGMKYTLFSASLYQHDRRHFVAAFPWDRSWIVYDGLKKSLQKKLPCYDSVSLTWYVQTLSSHGKNTSAEKL